MKVETTQLLQYINHEVYAQAKQAHALDFEWIGVNIYFTPSEFEEKGWIATPVVETFPSNSKETIEDYAKSSWKNYYIYSVDDILKEFE